MGGTLRPLRLAVLCVYLSLSGAGSQKTRACAKWCPENSECVDANACRCNPGFKSPEELITDPSDICDDINECFQGSLEICGKNANCENTDGSYHCTCRPGYELASGGKVFGNMTENTCRALRATRMTPTTSRVPTSSAAPGHLSDPPRVPPSSVAPGHLSDPPRVPTSSAAPGHLSDPPRTMRPRTPSGGLGRKITKDVNECTSGKHTCHASTHCMNKVGSYQCRCRPGWQPVPGSPNGPNSTVCQDVDECSSGQHGCHSSTVCSNTRGSYKCLCRPGWEPVPGSPSDPKDTVCQEPVSFPAWTPPSEAHSQSLSRFFDEVQDLLRNFTAAEAGRTIQKLIEAVDSLWEVPEDIESLPQSVRYQVATQLLSDLEQTFRTLARSLPKGSTRMSSSKTELSLVIKEPENRDVTTVGSQQARMNMDWAVATGAKPPENGRAVAGILSSPSLHSLLANASLDLNETRADLERFYDSPVRGADLKLLSNINSVFLTNTATQELTSPVNFTFSYHPESPGPREALICAFWQSDGSGSGHWSTAGCSVLGRLNGSVLCQCSHLSSFAVLMAQYHVQDPRLALVTKVGLSLSLFCLLLCILTFVLVRSIQSSRTTVHLHLCICLFVGSVIFLVGIENEGGGQVSVRCRVVAALLHYCFLAAFCWMGLEGLELYCLVVRVFRGQGLGTRWRCLLGYGVPLLVVAVSAAVHGQGYGRPTYCWLAYEDGFIWSFLGPLAFIILGNAVIFVTTVWKLTQKFSEINPDMKKLRKARVLTITAIAQLFMLGCTWVFGLFLFDPHSQWLSYTFTVLNCLQGLFLFVLLCLLNKKVREEYRRWACTVAGSKYSEFHTSSSGPSQNQTRALRPSESGM